jgi:hypothetical protein
MLRRRNYYVPLLIASVIYIVATFLAPLGPNRFNLTPSKTHLLQITIILPVIMIWAIAVYGAERFKSYSHNIKKYKDGHAMDQIANGITILIASSIINALFGSLRGWAMADGWLSPFTIASNYLNVIIPLIAFWYMFKGSNELMRFVKKRNYNSLPVIAVILIVIG